MKHSSTPWWRTDLYDHDAGIPPQLALRDYQGPKGYGLVRSWPSGITDPGWGLDSPSTGEGFMPRYMRGEFNQRRVLYGYDRDKWAFAFIMRSMSLGVIDIDGKNGGIEHAKRLGMLPPTMAETSKSGDGYHLWYELDDQWDDIKGFGLLGDRIGIEQGVDFRGTGCVYHHKQQRWNLRPPVKLPTHLFDTLRARDLKVEAGNARITAVLENNDDLEVLMMQDEILADLDKPIPQGKRNQTLFAIGSQAHLAGIPDWDEKILARADSLGLPTEEGDKIVANIKRYAGTP